MHHARKYSYANTTMNFLFRPVALFALFKSMVAMATFKYSMICVIFYFLKNCN